MDTIARYSNEEARREIEHMLVELGRMDPPPRFSKKHIRSKPFPKRKTPTPIPATISETVAPPRFQPKTLPCFADMILPDVKRIQLNASIRDNQRMIRQDVLAANADIIPRTQAQNRKSAHTTVEEERAFRAEIVAAQIQSWRSVLPSLIKKLSRIPDPRRTNGVHHKRTMLLLFGLFAFIFRLASRREMNRELTTPLIFEHLKQLFPEMDSIPHADTLARLLESINPTDIEAVKISLVQDLIRKKKFKKPLIQGCLPVSVDGTQKLTRDHVRQDTRWCERHVGPSEEGYQQQYLYVIEANITFKNGLTIPLMTEYLHRDNNKLAQPDGKQDSETTAFERMAKRLKAYFPRLKMLLFMDAMYATQPVMEILHNHKWAYLITLPKKKLKDLAERLNEQRSLRRIIPGQPAYRKRHQTFHWVNHITYGYEGQLQIHLIACLERYDTVNKKNRRN